MKPASAAALPRPFRYRAFVAIVATLTGLSLPISGFMNHYYQFAPFGVERHFWMSLHNSAAILFAVFAIWHGILNRKALLQHLKGNWLKLRAVSRESIYALLLVSVLVGLISSHAFHVGDSDGAHPPSSQHGPFGR